MIIYSPVPVEMLFKSEPEKNFQELTIDNRIIVVDQTQSSIPSIHRVISTDPQDYLNPNFQPGSRIRYKPEIEGREV